MITQEEYLNAISTVRKYHAQIEKELKLDSVLTCKEWAIKNSGNISKRLYNVFYYQHPDFPISDINRKHFMSSFFLQAGAYCWNEFDAIYNR
jgi:hypothetical protein